MKIISDNQIRPTFTTLSSISVVVGIVVGIGIFRLPPIVAGNSANELQFMAFWVAGGIISLLGALCYAELASSKPDAGGEYHFLSKAYGPSVGFLFTWGRMTVIQTGSIALIAFILGDYASLIVDLGTYSSTIYAVVTICVLTGVNLLGTDHSRRIQNVLTASIILMLVLLSVYSFLSTETSPATSVLSTPSTDVLFSDGSIGAAMIFVLLTYGGWNEASYLSGEVQNVRQNMIRVLTAGIGVITLIYVLVNYAYLEVLGLEGLRNSEAIGADLTVSVLGSGGAVILSLIVIVAAISTANATIITGARTNYALGRDFSVLNFLRSTLF